MNRPLMTLAALLTFAAAPAWAHGDEDHSHDEPPLPAATIGAAPQRLADGSLWVPKPVQRQLGLRTRVAEIGEHPQTVELNGRVIADPGAGGRVQAAQAGRVAPGPQGLALLGQRVRQGEVLGVLQPVAGSLERSGRQAELAELAAQLEVAERRLKRLEQLEGVVPQKEVEAAKYEAEGLRARKAALGGGLNTAQTLLAPVSGVVAAVSVVNGQIVDAREVLFEIVDPRRLAVEALAYDPALADAVGSASAVPGGTAGGVELAFVGAGKVLREQALPLLFRVKPAADGKAPALAVGQPLKVIVRTAMRQAGALLPLEALTRNAGGETIVWVHAGAERFLARPVRAIALDARTVAVTAGVKAGERIVVKGAAALGQVR